MYDRGSLGLDGPGRQRYTHLERMLYVRALARAPFQLSIPVFRSSRKTRAMNEKKK